MIMHMLLQEIHLLPVKKNSKTQKRLKKGKFPFPEPKGKIIQMKATKYLKSLFPKNIRKEQVQKGPLVMNCL